MTEFKRLSDGIIKEKLSETHYTARGMAFEARRQPLLRGQAIARAAEDGILKQIVEWGRGVCDKEHGFSVSTGKACLWKDCWHKPIFRKDCKKCWQSLKQQIEEAHQ